MAQQKFKTGDIVKLNSGGPEMTILKYEPGDSEEVICQWFSAHQFSERSFHQDTLRIFIAQPLIRKSHQLP